VGRTERDIESERKGNRAVVPPDERNGDQRKGGEGVERKEEIERAYHHPQGVIDLSPLTALICEKGWWW